MPTTYHFQWQNPILLKDIYPMRLQKLRDFLILLQGSRLVGRIQEQEHFHPCGGRESIRSRDELLPAPPNSSNTPTSRSTS